MARGGYRPGAGRPKGSTGKTESKKSKKTTQKKAKKPTLIVPEGETLTPLDYMLKVMNDPTVEAARRDRMAVAAAPFIHSRKGEGAGKKQEKDEKAKSAGAGRFAPSAPPRLAVVNK